MHMSGAQSCMSLEIDLFLTFNNQWSWKYNKTSVQGSSVNAKFLTGLLNHKKKLCSSCIFYFLFFLADKPKQPNKGLIILH